MATTDPLDNLRRAVHPTWVEPLTPVATDLVGMGEFLRAEQQAGRAFLPAGKDVLRAFQQPFDEVRVLVVGQDPYPTPGHAVGLSFSVAPHVQPVPRSLDNIFRELHDDLGVERPSNGDLTGWAEQGVLLLNRALTVQPRQPASHRGKGWEPITEHAIRALGQRGGPLVAILWGSHARSARDLLPGVPTIESVHPSPLSASRGFFGSRPFSRANAALVEQGGEPIDWASPPPR